MMPAIPEIALVALVLMCLLVMAGGAARLLVMIKGSVHRRRENGCAVNFDENILLASDLAPDIAILAVAPDASADSIQFVRRLTKLFLGRLEVVLALDGASDKDVDAWKREFHLKPVSRPAVGHLPAAAVNTVYASDEPISLTVVEKERGGHADSLNAALNLVEASVIATVDWNSRFSEEALLRLIRPMLDDPQGAVAVGAVAPPPSDGSPVSRLYRLEFLRTWLSRCAGMSAWNAFLPAPGAFLLFQRAAVLEARGFRGSRPGCMLDLMLHFHGIALAKQRPYHVRLIADAVSGPAVPRDRREARQLSSRDQMEIAGALRRRMGMAFGFGKVGGLAIPGLFFSRFLLPLLETASLLLAVAALVCGWIAPAELGLLLAGTVVFGTLVSMSAVVLEPAVAGAEMAPRELAALFFTAVRENLGYRQGRNLRLIRDFVRGFRAS